MQKRNLNYISLFSSAGVGCYGFKMEDFDCIVTNELIKKRLDIQKFNNVCKYESGYIAGDIQEDDVNNKIISEINKFKILENINEVDVIIATPPCQGMSVANHKKKDEKSRNSLVIQSIKITKKIQPRFFIFENVRSFLNTICTDIDGKDKKIKEAIELNLGGEYNILFKVINFKEYGNNSSRTRTLVIGTRKDLSEITPFDIFPDRKKEKTLRQIIGNFPKLSNFGEINKNDIYHSFRPYAKRMLNWIEGLKEGQSAFDNIDPEKRPCKIINGLKVFNQNKNGDKYKKCYWDKVAPCIHTRNDILASQSTIHPVDNRVFSIRELMKMMTIPDSFKWTKEELRELNILGLDEKRKFLSKEEMNIRQSIGEAVPTEIFKQIANKIKFYSKTRKMPLAEINRLISKKNLDNSANLLKYINNEFESHILTDLFRIVELSNAKRLENAAFYTQKDICFTLIKELPDYPESKKTINIIEPSVGVGSFLPLIFKKYEKVERVNFDLVDIDDISLKILKEILKKINIPSNFNIRLINQDFLLNNYDKHYDIAIGNPPFGKIAKNQELLKKYKLNKKNTKTSNVFSYFIEECIRISDTIALISPKSLLSAPAYSDTRKLLSDLEFKTIIDYGEKGFPGVKIETISFIIKNKKTPNKKNLVKIESYITQTIKLLRQDYIFDKKYPTWLIYRNNFFDTISKNLILNIFEAFRDRQITKKDTLKNGKIRVLKSKNIGSNKIINIDNYDCFINDISPFAVKKHYNKKRLIVVPNLTYKPRACFFPKNSIADGSVAILNPKNGFIIKKRDLSYYATEEFRKFYMIGRNLGTRSLNIDSNSIILWGVQKKYHK